MFDISVKRFAYPFLRYLFTVVTNGTYVMNYLQHGKQEYISKVNVCKTCFETRTDGRRVKTVFLFVISSIGRI